MDGNRSWQYVHYALRCRFFYQALALYRTMALLVFHCVQVSKSVLSLQVLAWPETATMTPLLLLWFHNRFPLRREHFFHIFLLQLSYILQVWAWHDSKHSLRFQFPHPIPRMLLIRYANNGRIHTKINKEALEIYCLALGETHTGMQHSWIQFLCCVYLCRQIPCVSSGFRSGHQLLCIRSSVRRVSMHLLQAWLHFYSFWLLRLQLPRLCGNMLADLCFLDSIELYLCRSSLIIFVSHVCAQYKRLVCRGFYLLRHGGLAWLLSPHWSFGHCVYSDNRPHNLPVRSVGFALLGFAPLHRLLASTSRCIHFRHGLLPLSENDKESECHCWNSSLDNQLILVPCIHSSFLRS